MGKIVGYIGLFSIVKTTSLGEGKTLNSKPEKCSSRKSVALWCTILLLSVRLVLH